MHACTVGGVIKEYLKGVGIDVTLYIPDRATFIQTIEHGPEGLSTYPMCIITGGTGPDVESAAVTLWDGRWPPPEGENFYWYSNSRVNELLDLMNTDPDQAKRKDYLYEMQDIIVDSANFIWLFNNYKAEIWNKDFTGFRTSNRPVTYMGNMAGV